MTTIKNDQSLWGYGIAAVYTIFAIATITFVAFAMTQKIELVAPDYYKNEIGYEQQINRVRQTNNLIQPITCQLSQDGKYLKIQFPPRHTAVEGTIKLYRPSESMLDFTLPIDPDEDGLQLIETAKMKRGAWRVQISWAMKGREFYNEFPLQLQ